MRCNCNDCKCLSSDECTDKCKCQCCNSEMTRREFITGGFIGKVEGIELSNFKETDFLNDEEVKRLVNQSKNA